MKNFEEIETGLLTDQMDTNSSAFDEFQAQLLNKSRNRSLEQKRKVELLALKYRIEEYLESDEGELQTAGTFLKAYLKAFQIKQIRFAEYIGLKPSNLSKLLKGERPLNYNLAIVLGQIFNLNPMLWIGIQAKNEMSLLKRTKEETYQKYSIQDLIN